MRRPTATAPRPRTAVLAPTLAALSTAVEYTPPCTTPQGVRGSGPSSGWPVTRESVISSMMRPAARRKALASKKELASSRGPPLVVDGRVVASVMRARIIADGKEFRRSPEDRRNLDRRRRHHHQLSTDGIGDRRGARRVDLPPPREGARAPPSLQRTGLRPR